MILYLKQLETVANINLLENKNALCLQRQAVTCSKIKDENINVMLNPYFMSTYCIGLGCTIIQKQVEDCFF